MAKQSSNVISRGRNRRNLDPSMRSISTNATASLGGVETTVITVNLSVPCSLNGVPQYLTVGANGALPVSAVMSSPSQVALTYAATQAASTLLTVPANDPALRTQTGGYVNPTSFDPNP